MRKKKADNEDWFRKRLFVFLFVALWAVVATAIGWTLGIIVVRFVGASEGFVEFGAFFGGWIGLAIGGLIGFRRNLYDAEWDRLTAIMPSSFWFIFGGVAAVCDLHPIVIAIVAAVGAGAGALLARYWLHFFDPEPPQRIL